MNRRVGSTLGNDAARYLIRLSWGDPSEGTLFTESSFRTFPRTISLLSSRQAIQGSQIGGKIITGSQIHSRQSLQDLFARAGWPHLIFSFRQTGNRPLEAL